MSEIVLVTDSTADIPSEIRERLGIEMVPLQVLFGEESYLDNVTLSPAQFFEKLKGFGGMPKTSQPSPNDFLAVFQRLIAERKTVISVHLSSAFSGTYQSALIAQSMLEGEGDVTVIDSKSASYGYGMLVVKSAELAKQGASKAEIVAEIARLRREMRLYFLVDTLEYLQRGGRIGKAAALFGTLLNIKPILTIGGDGVIYPVDKVRGQKRAFARIIELIEADFGAGPIDLIAVDTPGDTQAADELIEVLKGKFGVRQFHRSEIGSVVGAHTGPGTVGIFVLPAGSV
ncbi:DegV family protein [Cohnella nanjingensis]|uniref:DegV family protein n=1 Tax=Cohnella nanjingensis TaxID=1387779 RepID=A0A7X0VJF3_9BACL|nr:DegV family protein [Cohnella nanjingensis]MBB6675518.1 DegV family protein [Cohnella nanjingensis]